MAQSTQLAGLLSQTKNGERACSKVVEHESRDVLDYLEDILDLHLEAMRIRSGRSWSGYSQQAVVALSVRAFHTTRAAMIIAKAGYPAEAEPLIRVLEDVAEQCRLYSQDEMRAEQWLGGAWAPSAKRIREELGELTANSHDYLSDYLSRSVHSRSGAVASYLQRQSQGTMEWRVGPNPNPVKFKCIALMIAFWELRILAIEASIWPCLKEDQTWAKSFDELDGRWDIAADELDQAMEAEASAAG